jgi:uncharacterized DUF497 family protein
MAIAYDYGNLAKHRVSTNEVDDVLVSSSIDFDMEPGHGGNNRVMFVGFTNSGRLLEVGVEYIDFCNEHVFHAMNATRRYRILFPRSKGHGYR